MNAWHFLKEYQDLNHLLNPECERDCCETLQRFCCFASRGNRLMHRQCCMQFSLAANELSATQQNKLRLKDFPSRLNRPFNDNHPLNNCESTEQSKCPHSKCKNVWNSQTFKTYCGQCNYQSLGSLS